MIVSTIKQFGLRLRADPEEIPFQYSANVQMKFEKDENYNDYTVVGYYIPPGENEAKLLSINDDGTFILGPDCFKQRGTLSFSFNLINSIEEVHLGSIDFEVRYSFGDGDTILPEPEEVWISLVTQVAKDAIREEVALVKQKANEALQSASLANDKASEAEEYANNANQSAGSASLSASSALTAKNDAIAASNQALGFSNNASESAIEAKNSADEALENANASNKAIETVNQIKTQIEDKANEFDTNYQEKLSLFNDNATEKQNAFNQSVTSANDLFDKKVVDANNDLDSKLQQANTTIDEKVTEATEQAQKAKDEADRAEQATAGKLDKNQGIENAGKTMVVGADGNLVVGDSSPKNVYTKEEVDYMLADKMDKPYVPVEVADNATITDALEGNFKIDKIKGNTYQNVETDIVPTPDRPVPINSRKVKVNSEYVELRSLKESVNKFDLGLLSQTDLIPGNGAYRKIEIPIKLKPNTRYKIYYEKSMLPALTWAVLNIVNNAEGILVQILNVANKENNEVEKQAINLAFTSPNDGEIYFSYYVQSYDVEGDLVPQTPEIFKEKWFTKILKNIMITEESLNQTTYVAPTVRDYKIVDHVNKTAKIVRNVSLVDLSTINHQQKTGDTVENRYIAVYVYSISPPGKDGMWQHMYADKIKLIAYSGFPSELETSLLYSTYGVYVVVNGISTTEEYNEWIAKNNIFIQYALKTPNEESIPYVETDTSEVGLSWQDTTSPSPDIPSQIEGVNEIDITVTGKNLFDIEYVSNLENWTNSNIDGYFYIPIKVPKGKQLYLSNDKTIAGGRGYYANMSPYKEKNAENYYFFYHNTSGSAYGKFNGLTKGEVIYLRVNSIVANLPLFIEDFKHLQIEVGDTPTSYEPYTEQRVNITLPQPIYSTVDGSIADEVDVEKGVEVYNMGTIVYDGSNDEVWSAYPFKKGFTIQIAKLKSGTAVKGWCDKFVVKDNITDETGIILGLGNNYLYIAGVNDTIPTVEELRTWLSQNPITVIYPLATSIEIPISQEDLKLLKSLKTEQGVTNIFVGGEVKPTIEARYPRDLALVQQQLEQKILLISDSLIDTQAKVLLQGGN